MSEVKRVFSAGFTELPGCGDRCWSSAIDVDQWGARIEVYGMTSAEATELRDEVLSSITDFDAQRLRADTAEAELKKALELLSVSYQLLGLNSALVSYRQHMADIGEFISVQKGQFVPRCPNCGYTEQDCREQMDHHLCGFPEPPCAALNPKPEAGSHVDCGSCRNITDGCKGKCQRSEEWSKP